MKILFGVPIEVHNEIAQAEVLAMSNMGIDIVTCNYGNSGYIKGIIKSFNLVLKNAFNIKMKMQKYKPDIIYLNTSFDEKTIIRDTITIFIIRFFNRNIKVVLKLHGRKKDTVLAQKGFIPGLKRYLLKKIDLLLLLSTEEKNDFLKIGVSPDKLKITANSLDKSLYKEDELFKRTINPSIESLLLLYVGRLIKEKGILDLIEACVMLKKKGVKFKLVCVGEGSEKSKILEKIKLFDLEKYVDLIGYIPESATKAYYANCDILVLPSYSEGFPMAVFQAIAAGKPVITTRLTGSADHLKEGENCLWSKIGSPESIFEEILKLGKDVKLREYMRQNNLLLAEKFTKEKLAMDILKLMEDLLQHKGANRIKGNEIHEVKETYEHQI